MFITDNVGLQDVTKAPLQLHFQSCKGELLTRILYFPRVIAKSIISGILCQERLKTKGPDWRGLISIPPPSAPQEERRIFYTKRPPLPQRRPPFGGLQPRCEGSARKAAQGRTEEKEELLCDALTHGRLKRDGRKLWYAPPCEHRKSLLEMGPGSAKVLNLLSHWRET